MKVSISDGVLTFICWHADVNATSEKVRFVLLQMK
jgi:hypothetical protein